jgi:small subunit ribosomal protein S3Ae
MVTQKARTSTKKDKWKAKVWYNVMAPDMFNRVKVAEALGEEAEKMLGRIVEISAQEITNDMSKMHIKLRLKINDVRGLDAFTHFIGHDMTSDYVRRMTRRRKSKIDTAVDVKTRDNVPIRIKPLAISGKRIRSSQQTTMRVIMWKVISDFCSQRALDEVVKAMISGQMAKDVAVACKPIQPLQRVEIRKSEILDKTYVPSTPVQPVAEAAATGAPPAVGVPPTPEPPKEPQPAHVQIAPAPQ